MDIFDVAGIKKPNLSILSEEFLLEVKGMKQQNVAFELLKKLLNDEVSTRQGKNVVQSKKFSEMLQGIIKKYQNNLISTAEVIQELIDMAKDMQLEDKKVSDMGLSEEEYAFYSALAENPSAVTILGDEKLRDLSHFLVERIKKNISVDWEKRADVRAKLRLLVKKALKHYGYPPDLEKLAIDRVLEQSTEFAKIWG
jgi:type I restriction enzyme R subunit